MTLLPCRRAMGPALGAALALATACQADPVLEVAVVLSLTDVLPTAQAASVECEIYDADGQPIGDGQTFLVPEEPTFWTESIWSFQVIGPLDEGFEGEVIVRIFDAGGQRPAAYWDHGTCRLDIADTPVEFTPTGGFGYAGRVPVDCGTVEPYRITSSRANCTAPGSDPAGALFTFDRSFLETGDLPGLDD